MIDDFKIKKTKIEMNEYNIIFIIFIIIIIIGEILGCQNFMTKNGKLSNSILIDLFL